MGELLGVPSRRVGGGAVHLDSRLYTITNVLATEGLTAGEAGVAHGALR